LKARVLVCAGFEPAGRVGLLADVEAVSASGARAYGVVTAVTAQGRVFHAAPVRLATLRRQLRACLTDGRLGAVKLGMVPSRRHLAVVRTVLASFEGWWVVDPVVASARGERLSRLRASDYLALAARRAVLTPNLPELAWLTGTDAADPVVAARSLVGAGFGAVVVKGGHADGTAVDWVVSREGVLRLEGPRLRRSAHKRGTGCRFASALAGGLARGLSLEAAARRAKRVVRDYLRSISGPASGAP
jgi:hydroxymethylpyrimidine/phosphomethylpyrimidine kinase